MAGLRWDDSSTVCSGSIDSLMCWIDRLIDWCDSSLDWLIAWSVVRSIDWLLCCSVDWLTDWSIVRSIDWLIGCYHLCNDLSIFYGVQTSDFSTHVLQTLSSGCALRLVRARRGATLDCDGPLQRKFCNSLIQTPENHRVLLYFARFTHVLIWLSGVSRGGIDPPGQSRRYGVLLYVHAERGRLTQAQSHDSVQHAEERPQATLDWSTQRYHSFYRNKKWKNEKSNINKISEINNKNLIR